MEHKIIKQDQNKIAILKISHNDATLRSVEFERIEPDDLIDLANALRRNTHVVDIIIHLHTPYPVSSRTEIRLWQSCEEIELKLSENRGLQCRL